MIVLGIETSCDDTAVALYDSIKGLLAHKVYSQSTHAAYGGVVPELASRDHLRKVLPLLQQVLAETALNPHAIEGIAYTVGPGLAGALLVGAMLGRSLAYAWQVPSIGVHHMEAHLLAPMLEANKPELPFLALLVSGGHTMLVKVHAIGRYELLGESLDDAVGEAFDKTAKLLGLPYPGGAALEQLAKQGNPKRFNFPRPLQNREDFAFSFSGLKTHVARLIQSQPLDQQLRADIAAGFQAAVIDVLVSKCRHALMMTGLQRLVVAGGVGANLSLRHRLQAMTATMSAQVFYPGLQFCTDNAAMVAYAGWHYLSRGQKDGLAIQVLPRWPLADRF